MAITDLDPLRDLHLTSNDRASLYRYCRDCPLTHHCCYRASTIVVLPHEAKKIIERTGRADLLRSEKAGLFTIAKNPGSPCPFLDTNNLCSIYEDRPSDCRSWPLTLSRSPDEGFSVDLDCPAAPDVSLDSRFLSAAVETLTAIDTDHQEAYSELVHRDSLPLVPLKLSRKE